MVDPVMLTEAAQRRPFTRPSFSMAYADSKHPKKPPAKKVPLAALTNVTVWAYAGSVGTAESFKDE